MGVKCGKVTCCGLCVHRSNPDCYSLFEQSYGVGSREARVSPISAWQVRDQRLTSYSLLYWFFPFPSPLRLRFQQDEPFLSLSLKLVAPV